MLKHLSILAAAAAIAAPLWAIPAQAATTASCQAELNSVDNDYKNDKISHFISMDERAKLKKEMVRAADDNANKMPNKCVSVLNHEQTQLVYIEGRWLQ